MNIMKKITLILFALLASWQVNAQVSSYVFTNSSGTYVENSAAATALANVRADSYLSAAQNIGFNFVYDGISRTQFKMSSNGFISFNMVGTTSLTSNDFSTASPDSRPIIAPLWDDLDAAQTITSSATYEVTGVAPNRVLTVEWRNWEWNYSANNAVISFQVKLYETTNVIEFVYRQEANPINATGSASIGIGSSVGSGSGSFLNLTSITTPAVSSSTSVTNISAKPATGQIYRFTPPTCIAPAGYNTDLVTINSANISWAAVNPAPATGYEYYYSNVNTAPVGAGTPVSGVTASITGLNVSTTYYVWLRSDCSSGDFSNWSGPYTFTTSCPAVTDFVEGFETTTGSAFPNCWAKVGTLGTADTRANTAISGARLMYIYGSAISNRPVVSMVPVSNANAGTHRMIMKVRANLTIGETIELGYLTNATDATTFVPINSIVTNSLTVPQFFVTIPSGLPAGEIVFALKTGTQLASVLIDDVAWEPIPTVVPTCITAANPANNALAVAIESNISWLANVDATGYFLKIGTSPNGSDFLANTDLGNVLSYNPPSDLEYSTTYFLTLTPYNAFGAASSCTETTFTTKDAPLTGSVCADPILISPGALPYTTTDNTNLYGNDYANGSTQCSAYYMSGDDVVYAITPIANMSVDIVLSNIGSTYSGIHVLDGCPNSTTPPNCIAFAGDSGITTRNLLDVSLTGGTTYYIVISTFASPQSTSYTLTVTENTCVNPTVVFSKPNNCPTSTFNAIADITNLGSATSLTVSDNQGSASQVVSATGNVSFGPYPFGTNVVLTVVNNQDISCTVTSANLMIAGCPPANDDCANAIVVTIPYSNTQDATNATNNAGFITTCSIGMNDGVWYSVVGNGQNITVALTGVTGWDAELAIYTGSCGIFTCVGSVDSGYSGENETYIIVGSIVGTTYYINVGHFNSSANQLEGPFTIDVTSPLSSNSFDSANFVAYPNPVKDVFNLSYTSEISSVRVLNLLGQEVVSKTVNATTTQVDMSQLSAGTYIVNVTVGDSVKSIKVIKQ